MVSEPLKLSDLDAASGATLELILAEADKNIESQVKLMLASDARANGLLAAAVTLSAAALAVIGTELKDDSIDALLWAATIFLVLEVTSSAFAIASLWPVGIRVQGWTPDKFIENLALKDTDECIKREMVYFTHKAILSNRSAGVRAGWTSRLAMFFLAAGPIAGGIAGWISFHQA